ncbi:SA1788 family PVL leukocidin-associated protein [Staphylococcus americanisciuri]|uniref:Uncharacterized protein n=1 Tax=Staphylococcus americanisciuri TaxID=2973940 RepID=A0ABT2F463_9STAP|nr:SA1788 family PVL leukocidin-associated protein [Staphylococcus americanisciuri]MCS4487214.1 hypothetical protein [Staphylococcus americanisciuri]
MLELPEIHNDRTKKIDYKGQTVSIAQIAEASGFSKNTVRKKLKQGVDIKEIINDTYHKRLKLTKEQIKKKDRKALTLSTIEERLANGWSIDLALELSSQYVGSVDNIVFKSKIRGIDIEIPYKQLLELEKVGITASVIGLRVSKGMTLEQAMTKPVVKDINPHEQETLIVNYEEIDEINERLTEAGVRRYREERLRKSKPHLRTVPQNHELSDYGRYLMSRSGIARVKTDLYGNVQFI